MTMYGSPVAGSVPASKMRAMWSVWMAPASLASRLKRDTAAGLALSSPGLITLTATLREVPCSTAS